MVPSGMTITHDSSAHVFLAEYSGNRGEGRVAVGDGISNGSA